MCLQKEEKEDKAKLFKEMGSLKMDVEFIKKNAAKVVEEKKAMVNLYHPILSICRQCELLELSYYVSFQQPAKESDENLRLME